MLLPESSHMILLYPGSGALRIALSCGAGSDPGPTEAELVGAAGMSIVYVVACCSLGDMKVGGCGCERT